MRISDSIERGIIKEEGPFDRAGFLERVDKLVLKRYEESRRLLGQIEEKRVELSGKELAGFWEDLTGLTERFVEGEEYNSKMEGINPKTERDEYVKRLAVYLSGKKKSFDGLGQIKALDEIAREEFAEEREVALLSLVGVMMALGQVRFEPDILKQEVSKEAKTEEKIPGIKERSWTQLYVSWLAILATFGVTAGKFGEAVVEEIGGTLESVELKEKWRDYLRNLPVSKEKKEKWEEQWVLDDWLGKQKKRIEGGETTLEDLKKDGLRKDSLTFEVLKSKQDWIMEMVEAGGPFWMKDFIGKKSNWFIVNEQVGNLIGVAQIFGYQGDNFEEARSYIDHKVEPLMRKNLGYFLEADLLELGMDGDLVPYYGENYQYNFDGYYDKPELSEPQAKVPLGERVGEWTTEVTEKVKELIEEAKEIIEQWTEIFAEEIEGNAQEMLQGIETVMENADHLDHAELAMDMTEIQLQPAYPEAGQLEVKTGLTDIAEMTFAWFMIASDLTGRARMGAAGRLIKWAEQLEERQSLGLLKTLRILGRRLLTPGRRRKELDQIVERATERRERFREVLSQERTESEGVKPKKVFESRLFEKPLDEEVLKAKLNNPDDLDIQALVFNRGGGWMRSAERDDPRRKIFMEFLGYREFDDNAHEHFEKLMREPWRVFRRLRTALLNRAEARGERKRLTDKEKRLVALYRVLRGSVEQLKRWRQGQIDDSLTGGNKYSYEEKT